MSPMQASGYRCACIPCLFVNKQRGSAVTTVHQVAMLESRQKNTSLQLRYYLLPCKACCPSSAIA